MELYTPEKASLEAEEIRKKALKAKQSGGETGEPTSIDYTEAELQNNAMNEAKLMIRELGRKGEALTKQHVYQYLDKIEKNKDKIDFLEELRKNYSVVTPPGMVDSDKVIFDLLAELCEEEEQVENFKSVDRHIRTSESYRESSKDLEARVKTSKEIMVDKIIKLHDYKPEAVFLTQTSSTLFGWTIKEAWKEAWPQEQTPLFLTIDVSPIKHFLLDPNLTSTQRAYSEDKVKKELSEGKYGAETFEEYRQQLVEKIQSQLLRYHVKSRIAIVDEMVVDGRSLQHVTQILERAINTAGEDISIKTFNLEQQREAEGPFWRYHSYPSGKRDENENIDWRNGKLKLNKAEKDIAKQRVEQFKDYGKNIGQEILKRGEIKSFEK